MRYPVIVLVGQKGAGKDTVAEMISKATGGVIVALADPLKQLIQKFYNFDDQQLWGPSDERSRPSFLNSDLKSELWLKNSFGMDDRRFKEVYLHLKYVYPDLTGIVSGETKQFIPRVVLQTVGDKIRELVPDFWWQSNLRIIEKCLLSGDRYHRQSGSFYNGIDKPVCNLVIVPDARYRNEILALKRLGATIIKVVDPAYVNKDPHPSEKEIESIPDFWYNVILKNKKEAGLKGLEYAVERIVFEYFKQIPEEHSAYFCK